MNHTQPSSTSSVTLSTTDAAKILSMLNRQADELLTLQASRREEQQHFLNTLHELSTTFARYAANTTINDNLDEIASLAIDLDNAELPVISTLLQETQELAARITNTLNDS